MPVGTYNYTLTNSIPEFGIYEYTVDDSFAPLEGVEFSGVRAELWNNSSDTMITDSNSDSGLEPTWVP